MYVPATATPGHGVGLLHRSRWRCRRYWVQVCASVPVGAVGQRDAVRYLVTLVPITGTQPSLQCESETE